MQQQAMKMHGSLVVRVHEILTSTLGATVVLNTPAISRWRNRPGTQKIRGYENTRSGFGRVMNQPRNSRPVFPNCSSMEKHPQISSYPKEPLPMKMNTGHKI
jgi:hypothetical protein